MHGVCPHSLQHWPQSGRHSITSSVPSSPRSGGTRPRSVSRCFAFFDDMALSPATRPGSAVATSGDYADLKDTPAIPPAPVNADWNATSGLAQILNKPSSFAASLPTLTIELGNSNQANSGCGIDHGNWYGLDFNIGVSASNGFKYSVASDGSLLLGATGLYLVCGSAKMIPLASDTYQMPAQITAATGQQYTFPGVYQYAVQNYPAPPLSTLATGGSLGTLALFGAIGDWQAGMSTWLGFSKVPGTQNQNPLHLQGYLSYIKIG